MVIAEARPIPQAAPVAQVAGEMALALAPKEVLHKEHLGQQIAAVVLAVEQLDLQAVLAS